MNLRRTENVELVQGLHTMCFPGDDWEPASAYWLAWDDGAPVGFCSAKKLARENAVFLTRAGVLQRARGHGLQRRMIRARVAWARSKGAETVITYATYDNHPSIANLLKCGFVMYLPDYEWAEGCHYFWKSL